jgi:hypothetical protein
MGIIFRGFELGEPSLSQPSGGFLMCHVCHGAIVPYRNKKDTIRIQKARCIKLSKPGWQLFSICIF